MQNDLALTVAPDETGVTVQEEMRVWLLTTIDALNDAPFKVVDATVQRSYTMREAATHLLCISLAHAKDRWTKGQVTLTEMGEHEHDFYAYVNNRTGRSYSSTAIDNLIDVGMTWFISPPKGVPVPTQIALFNAAGRPTGDIVPFDPLTVGVSKLVHAKAAYKRGTFNGNDEAWGRLFNPRVGVAVFLDFLRELKHPLVYDQAAIPYVPTSTLRLFVEGPYLVTRNENGDDEIVAEINWEGMTGSNAIRDAWQTIVDACGVRGWME